jgi:hypothetical protein
VVTASTVYMFICPSPLGSRIVWVENAQTGEMIPIVRRTATSSGNARQNGKGGEASVGDDEEDELLDLEQGNSVGSGDHYSSNNTSVPPLPPPLDDSVDPRTGKPLGSSSSTGSSGNGALSALQRQEEEIAPIVRYHNLVMVQRATYLVFQVRCS